MFMKEEKKQTKNISSKYYWALRGSSGSRLQHTICTTSFVIDLEISKKDLDQQGKNVMLEKNTRRHKGSSFTWLDISDSVI